MKHNWLKPVFAVAVLAIAGGAIVLAKMPTDTAAPMKSNDQAAPHARSDRKVLYWWDPMLGPSSIRDHPGKSAMGMDLVPVYADETSAGPGVTIDPAVVQNMGVQTAPVVRGPMRVSVRVVGYLKLPEPGLHDVSLKVGGWIDKLYADQMGMHVRRGEPLFAVYSQDLQVAEEELIAAVRSRRALDAGASESLRKEVDGLVDSARRKLELWDVAGEDIDAIARADRPPRDIIFRSPATGHLEEKLVVQGSAVQPGQKLLQIADHQTMWLDGQVYEEQIPLVHLGQTMKATIAGIPGRTFTGVVSFIYPHLDHMTRTLTVRASFENPDFQLKPGMYAEAGIVTEPVSDAIQAPQEAVIDTGARQLVFVAGGDGHFMPRDVRTGIRGDDDTVQILQGLTVGETVVTSGQFLMDVESRTQEAIAKLRGGASEVVPQPAAAATTMPAASQPATGPSSLSLVYCPMADATWLQPPGTVANPYLDEDMRTCGQVRSKVQMPPADSSLSAVTKAYLAVQHDLATGKFDPTAAAQLKSVSDHLTGERYAALRQAADKLASTRDLSAAQSQFKAVSEALEPLLQQAQKGKGGK